MHKKTLEELAFYRIRDEIAQRCASEEGKNILLKREPFSSKQKDMISELKSLGSQWQKALSSSSGIRLESWNPVKPFLKALRIENSTLEQEQVFALLTFATSALNVYASIKTCSKEVAMKSLCDTSEHLDYSALQSVQNAISRIIAPDGTLKDIPALRDIKKKISDKNAEINASLKKYTSDPKMNQILESNVPAFRAGRPLLAVKANQRLSVSGIVHEASASGQTLYIEPEEVVRKNNELIQQEAHLAQETRKIFTELTAQLSEHYNALISALEIMEKLDATYAAARWGNERSCVWACDCEESQSPELLKGRHPLLGEKAVPIDIKFLKGKNVLIITGPNTGGKTVSIKTFALFSMMNQAGFPVPAAEGTRLKIFDSIFADIGDEQSIDESLSTFSAHMKNIAAAVRHADHKSLVLLDELGSGTDPQEGGAIAMAALDALIDKKSFVLVTTHHGILKNYGYMNESCVNASAEFDTDTLSPTYRLLMGVPGESHALDIARRSGLPAVTVEKAKSYITSHQSDVSTLIQGLTQKHAELAEREKTFARNEKMLSEKILRLDGKEISLRQKENEIKERESRDESRFLREVRKSLENLVRELREGEITREKTLKVKNFIDDLSHSVESQEEAIENEKEKIEKDKKELDRRVEESNSVKILENGMRIVQAENTRPESSKKTKKRLSNKEALLSATSTYTDDEIISLSPKKKSKPAQEKLAFIEGAEVLAGNARAKGMLVREEKKGVWLVQLGSLRMSFKERDLTLVRPTAAKAAEYTVELSGNIGGENSVFSESELTSSPQFELRLLGMREAEAIRVLQKQLDLCTMHSFKNFSVIHGKGNGILQQAVQDYLSNYPGVKNFYYAAPEDGGFGKTYVEMM